MATNPVQRDQAFPYGLVPLALYFVVIEFFVVDLTLRVWPPGRLMTSFFESLRQGVGFTLHYFYPAVLEFTALAVIALGVVLVFAALMRKRMFRNLLAVWLFLNLLYVLVIGLWGYWPDMVMWSVLYLAVVLISCAGIFYAFRSKGVAAFFNR
jgi:hypothetical protein